MSLNIKILLTRFLKGFLSGAIGAMVLVIPQNITTYNEIQTWITTLSIAGIVGGISGALLALDKATRLPK
jgi:VIT1/CCC1 family predicted Fe2+/Mn2+ transporter